MNVEDSTNLKYYLVSAYNQLQGGLTLNRFNVAIDPEKSSIYKFLADNPTIYPLAIFELTKAEYDYFSTAAFKERLMSGVHGHAQ